MIKRQLKKIGQAQKKILKKYWDRKYFKSVNSKSWDSARGK